MASKLKEIKQTGNSHVTSVTKKSKDGKEVRISVEEILNGYLIIRSTEWNDPKKGWQYKTERMFSATNPLDFDPDESLAEAFNS